MLQLNQANVISLPRDEFTETFSVIKEILQHDGHPDDFVVEDPFWSSCTIKVDLLKHLQRLYERMVDAHQALSPHAQVVTIDFSY